MKILITYPDSFPGVFLKKSLENSYEIIDKKTDYEDIEAVRKILAETSPDVIILNVPFSGGIQLNIERPALLITKNTTAQLNTIVCAFEHEIGKLFFIGSSCMYPRNFNESMSEKDLFSGPLEETNLAYATSKISGWQLCKAYNKEHGTKYRTLIPANLFGEHDDFSVENAHVIGALLNRFHKAKKEDRKVVTVWGTGEPVRDFLYAGDFADAVRFCLEQDLSWEEMNIGSGRGHSIKELVEIIAEIVDYRGEIKYDTTKPDGMKVKVLNSERINQAGWSPTTSLKESMEKTYEWYKGR